MLPLILLPAEINAITMEKNCKKKVIKAFSRGSSQVLLILLTKVIALYIRLIIIQIR